MLLRSPAFSWGEVPDSYGELSGDREVCVGNRKGQPFVPYSRILERLVCGLDGDSERFAVGPNLSGDIEL